MYRIYLWEKIQAAEADIRAGRVKSHEHVMKEAAKWLNVVSMTQAREHRQTIQPRLIP